jgi:hypothetical protein
MLGLRRETHQEAVTVGAPRPSNCPCCHRMTPCSSLPVQHAPAGTQRNARTPRGVTAAAGPRPLLPARLRSG